MVEVRARDEQALRRAANRGDLKAAFALIEILDARESFTESAALLAAAARAGSIEAIAELGARSALGAGVPVDLATARGLLEFAADRGHTGCPGRLARLVMAEAAPDSRVPRIIEWLARDARAGVRQASDDLAALAGERTAADSDLVEEYSAAARDFAWTSPLPVEWLSQEPEIGTIENVLSPIVCARIVEDARPAMSAAGVTDRATGQFALDAARTNTSAQLAFFAQPMALAVAKRRIATLARQPAMHLERTNVLRYRERQAFAPHWDYLDPVAEGFAGELAEQGQRVATCLIGLSSGYTGGETDFPELGITVRLAPGGALLFYNVDDQGRPEPRSLHAGMPVSDGEKWVVSQWIRTRPNRL